MPQSVFVPPFVIAVIVGIICAISIALSSLLGQNTKVVFCDVGQGDASYIRVINKIDVLIDAGPDRSVLSCLGDNMPYYDKTIEIVVISHPHKDHYYGLTQIMDRYELGTVFLSPFISEDSEFQKLIEKIKRHHVSIKYLMSNDNIKVASGNIKIYWPNYTYIKSIPNYHGVPVTNNSTDPNEPSIVLIYSQSDVNILYTGDAQSWVLKDIFSKNRSKISILKVPHHGSVTGLDEDTLNLIRPRISIISVGKKNFYHHPSPDVIEYYKKSKRILLRTDEVGEIRFNIVNGLVYRE